HPKTNAVLAAAVFSVLSLTGVSAQEPSGKDAQAHEASKGKPARATPGDYQAHRQVGGVTLAAEFTGHSILTQNTTLSNENYIAVEVALFGATPDADTT